MNKWDYLLLNSTFYHDEKKCHIQIGSNNLEVVKIIVNEIFEKTEKYFSLVNGIRITKQTLNSSVLGHEVHLEIEPCSSDGNKKDKINSNDLSYFLLNIAIENKWEPFPGESSKFIRYNDN
jgi:hypothetical protein